ncbi:MAG TPA: Ig-like domain-containing protein [Thermoanaerobaculia bacterium]|nr:Ig-like domain-containing protein [Thermoanaerobaculia bacterium]
MNRRLSVLLVFLVAASLPLSISAQQTAVPLGSSAAPYGYYEYLPLGYDDASTDEWPVVIFLHGSGERGNGTSELSKVLAQGLPQNVNSGTQYPFLLVSPQSPSTVGSWNVSNLDTMVQFIKSNYHVDEDRIYLTGLSMGGIGTWNYAKTNPEELAAIWPTCGAPGGTPAGAQLVNVPTWAFHCWGDTQSGASTANTVQWINSIAQALGATGSVIDNYPGAYTGPPGPGNTSDKDRTASFNDATNTWTWNDGVSQVAGSHPTLTLYRDTSHNCWTRTYNNSTPMKWLLAQIRHGAANKAPTVTITAPANNATFTDPVSVTITAQVADSDGSISRVELYAGSQSLGTDNSAPHQLVWSNPPAGTHWITVKATDNDGDVTAALAKITVNINSPAALFQQDFQSSTSVSSYVNATSPNGGQFNDISAEADGGTWSIQQGRLQLVREGSGTTDINDAGITRSTDFSSSPAVLHVTFDLGVTAWTASQFQSNALLLSVGNVSSFIEYGGGGVAANFFQTLSVNGEGPGQFSFSTAGVESSHFNTDGALHQVELFLNKSGAAASYRAPDGTLKSLRSNGVALWVDSTAVVVDAAATNGSSSALTDMRLRWANPEDATWTLDNFVVQDSFPQ